MPESSDSYVSKQELLSVRELRTRFGGNNIPTDLDTDYNLVRWIREFKGNVDHAETSLQGYIESRHAAGFDGPDFIEKFDDIHWIREKLPYLSMSKMKTVVNEKSNSIVVIGRAQGVDYRKIVSVMRGSELILTYFAYGEHVHRMFLEQERLSGRPSGVICLFDLGGIHMADYVVSGGALLQVSRMCINVMQKWYNTEGLEALVFLNPPKIMRFFYTLAKLVMNEGTRKKIHLITKPEKQLPGILSPDAIPEAFGGTLRDDSGWSNPPDVCANRPITITPADYSYPGEIWKREAGIVEIPTLSVEHVSKKSSFRIEREVSESGQKLLWLFCVNGEIEFEVTREESEGKSVLVYPRMTLTTPKLPEEGFVLCDQPGNFVLTFRNLSSYVFDIKLDYAVELKA